MQCISANARSIAKRDRKVNLSLRQSCIPFLIQSSVTYVICLTSHLLVCLVRVRESFRTIGARTLLHLDQWKERVKEEKEEMG